MNLLHAAILLIIPIAFAFVKRPNVTIKPHPLSANFKKGPVYVHTTMSPESRKRNHRLFPQTVTKYVVKTYTPSPYEAKARSDNRRTHSKLSSVSKTRSLPTPPKFNHLQRKSMSMGLYNKKTKALNEELLRDGIPQISIGIDSEEVNTETNNNFAEEFNQELLNDMQITDNFDDEIDPYQGTLRIKGMKNHPHYSSKDLYAEAMRSKTKYAIKDASRKAELEEKNYLNEKVNLNDNIIEREQIVNVTMDEKPEEAPVVVAQVFNNNEPNPPSAKFDYLRPKRNTKYYAQDLDDLNKDMEELIFVRRFDNEINVDEVKQKDDSLMEFGKNFREGIRKGAVSTVHHHHHLPSVPVANPA